MVVRRSPLRAIPSARKPKRLTKPQQADVDYHIGNAQSAMWNKDITETTPLKELQVAVRILKKAESKKKK